MVHLLGHDPASRQKWHTYPASLSPAGPTLAHHAPNPCPYLTARRLPLGFPFFPGNPGLNARLTQPQPSLPSILSNPLQPTRRRHRLKGVDGRYPVLPPDPSTKQHPSIWRGVANKQCGCQAATTRPPNPRPHRDKVHCHGQWWRLRAYLPQVQSTSQSCSSAQGNPKQSTHPEWKIRIPSN